MHQDQLKAAFASALKSDGYTRERFLRLAEALEHGIIDAETFDMQYQITIKMVESNQRRLAKSNDNIFERLEAVA